MQSFFTQNEFEKSVEAGAFKKVLLRASWRHFTIAGEMRSGGFCELMTTRGKLRTFLNPAAALALCRRMGVTTAEVRLEEWDLEMTALAMRMRPDVTARRLRAKRIADALYDRTMPPEPEIATREDQLNKLIDKKIRVARQLADARYPPRKRRAD